MSHVYKAFDTVIGRTVAVKILVEPASQIPKPATASWRKRKPPPGNPRKRHQHLRFRYRRRDGLFMVMEFLQGEDLRHAIKNAIRATCAANCKFALQIARALDFIHKNRIIHRDIKPENVHINTAGVVKLMDSELPRAKISRARSRAMCSGRPTTWRPNRCGESNSPAW